jgi:hypothetical protein
MAGNVWEWTSDWYDAGYYSRSSSRDPQGPEGGTLKVMRGGCWLSGENSLRTTCRKAELPGLWAPNVGFRCVYPEGAKYVFQPTFCGTASNFGLILPIPATLTASAALSDRQAFSTVDHMSQPQVVTTTVCGGRNAGYGGASGTAPSSMVDAGTTTVVSSGHVGFLLGSAQG